MKQKLLNSIRLRVMMLVALLCATFTGTAWGETETLTFVQTSTSAGTLTGAPTGVTATFSTTYSTKDQLTSGNSMTLTLSGWDANTTIKGVTLEVKNNKSKGNGTATVKIGSTTLGTLSITGLGNTYQEKAVTITETKTTSDLVVTIAATENSVYCDKFIISYEAGPVTPTCATPTFSVAAGTYTSTQSVELSTETEDATIYYTTDGATPTTSSSVYSSAITVSETQTIKAIAVKDGLDNSSVASATYTIVNLTHAGTSEDPYSVADARTAIDANYGKTGVYATGIVSEIVTAYDSGFGNITFDIIDQGGSNTLRAYRCGGTDASDVTVGDVVVVSGNLTLYNDIYEFSQGCELVSLVHKPAVPTFSPAAGAVVSGTPVTLACLTDGATIYYTTDGSTPTTSSSVYSSAITVTENMTIKAIAVKDEQSSDVAEAAYTIALPVATPTFSPAAGTYSSAQSVTISTETADATIYYSYDNENWTAYTSAITVDETKTVYAKAEKDGMVTSAVASAVFTIQIPSITFSEATPKNLTYEAQTHDVAFTSVYTSGTLAAVLCDSEGNTTTYDWFSAEVNGGAVRVTLTKNEDTVNSRTAYFKVTADNATSAVFAVVQAKFVADYATLPFEWAGGASSNLTALTGVTASGIGSDYGAANAPYLVKFDNTGDYIQIKTDGQPGVVSIGVKMIGGGNTSSITVKQSADGETFTDVETMNISGKQNDEVGLETTNAFASTSRYVRLYFTKGSNVGVGPISIAKASTEPAIVAESTLALADNATSGEIAYSINNPNGNTLTATSEDGWISDITVTATKVTFTTTANTGAEREGTITLSYEGATDKVITVTQAEYVVELTYNLVSSITSGKHYVIVNRENSMAVGAQNDNNRAAVSVTNSNDKVTFNSNAGVTEFIIYGPDAGGLYTIYDASENGYLYAASSGSNHLKTQAGIDDNARWEITFDGEDVASIVAQGSNSRNVMQYNSNSTLFSCYGSASQSNVYLYEKDGEATPTESVTVGAAGYTTYTTVNPVSFPTGVTAYIATQVNAKTIHLEEVLDAPARTPLVIQAEAGSYTLERDYAGLYNDIVAATPNLLKSSNGTVTGDLSTIFALGVGKTGENEGKIGFYLVDDGVAVPAGKAYMVVQAGGGVKGFTFDGLATGINTVANSQQPIANSPIYNLSGQRMSKMQRGVNIVNGKKVLVK